MFTIPEGGPYYAGSNLSLRCIIQVDPVVDIPYDVTAEWRKSGAVLGSDDRISVSNLTQQSSYTYLSNVNFNPLSSTSDMGIYTCHVTVDANPPLMHVRSIIHSDTEMLTVQSKTAVHKII